MTLLYYFDLKNDRAFYIIYLRNTYAGWDVLGQLQVRETNGIGLSGDWVFILNRFPSTGRRFSSPPCFDNRPIVGLNIGGHPVSVCRPCFVPSHRYFYRPSYSFTFLSVTLLDWFLAL